MSGTKTYLQSAPSEYEPYTPREATFSCKDTHKTTTCVGFCCLGPTIQEKILQHLPPSDLIMAVQNIRELEFRYLNIKRWDLGLFDWEQLVYLYHWNHSILEYNLVNESRSRKTVRKQRNRLGLITNGIHNVNRVKYKLIAQIGRKLDKFISSEWQNRPKSQRSLTPSSVYSFRVFQLYKLKSHAPLDDYPEEISDIALEAARTYKVIQKLILIEREQCRQRNKWSPKLAQIPLVERKLAAPDDFAVSLLLVCFATGTCTEYMKKKEIQSSELSFDPNLYPNAPPFLWAEFYQDLVFNLGERGVEFITEGLALLGEIRGSVTANLSRLRGFRWQLHCRFSIYEDTYATFVTSHWLDQTLHFLQPNLDEAHEIEVIRHLEKQLIIDRCDVWYKIDDFIPWKTLFTKEVELRLHPHKQLANFAESGNSAFKDANLELQLVAEAGNFSFPPP
ncbi:hypothetical protein TWF694_008355 [Orbilia ellipsospora]|uniref:F-box domain-containing protein n=1 Tax=Orbilia ellipsospora TaxID=2528407 RepID=A0AAV9XII0_9PEZI